jgi:hypothetical protein
MRLASSGGPERPVLVAFPAGRNGEHAVYSGDCRAPSLVRRWLDAVCSTPLPPPRAAADSGLAAAMRRARRDAK